MADFAKEEKAFQTYAAIAVGLVCVVVGLPLWWKTTEVYRVTLPYSDMESLTNANVDYGVHFEVVLTHSIAENTQFVSELTQRIKLFESQAEGHVQNHYRGIVRLVSSAENAVLMSTLSLEELDEQIDRLETLQESGHYVVYLLTSDHFTRPTTIGRHHAAYIPIMKDVGVDEVYRAVQYVVRDVFVNEPAVVRSFQSAKGAVHLQSDKASMRSVRSTPGYEVTFTLLNPQPDMIHVTWDIKGAINRYLQPLLTAYAGYADINIKSQFVHQTGLGVMAEKIANSNGFKLRTEQLPHIINPIEAYLGSHMSNNPNLNFIVYIPTRDQSPLSIYDVNDMQSSANAFLSPRWGGLFVYNVDVVTSNVSLPVDVKLDMKRVMSVFTAQLRLLLGLHTNMSSEHIQVMSPGNSIISDWELSAWLRQRCIENIATSSVTLSSLAQLLEEISNIVINDNIGHQVSSAVSLIAQSKQYLQTAKLKEAFLTSKQAITESEKAFFDPSLLELLYFPEDQKFAIYIPLFLPMCIPVVMSLVQAGKWIRTQHTTDMKDNN